MADSTPQTYSVISLTLVYKYAKQLEEFEINFGCVILEKMNFIEKK